jgi:hypothetical protein
MRLFKSILFSPFSTLLFITGQYAEKLAEDGNAVNYAADGAGALYVAFREEREGQTG